MTGIRPAPTPAAGRFLEEAHTLWYNDRMLTIFSKVLVVFLMIAIGYAAEKQHILPEKTVDVLNTYVMKLALPSMIISSMTRRASQYS